MARNKVLTSCAKDFLSLKVFKAIAVWQSYLWAVWRMFREKHELIIWLQLIFRMSRNRHRNAAWAGSAERRNLWLSKTLSCYQQQLLPFFPRHVSGNRIKTNAVPTLSCSRKKDTILRASRHQALWGNWPYCLFQDLSLVQIFPCACVIAKAVTCFVRSAASSYYKSWSSQTHWKIFV